MRDLQNAIDDILLLVALVLCLGAMGKGADNPQLGLRPDASQNAERWAVASIYQLECVFVQDRDGYWRLYVITHRANLDTLRQWYSRRKYQREVTTDCETWWRETHLKVNQARKEMHLAP